MTTDSPLRVSYSAVQDWRECQQRYFYRYVERLRSKVDAPAPTLGRAIHLYLELYYGGAISKDGKPVKLKPETLHKRALKGMQDAMGKECADLAWVANEVGQTQVAADLQTVVPQATDLMRAYFRVHGKRDLEIMTVQMVETDLLVPVTVDIELPGKADLVSANWNTISLWEHKSTKSVPEQGRRFRDLQTLLYAVMLEMQHGITVNQIVWNYIRTTPLQHPEPLKNAGGGLTRRKDLNTTVELYMEAINEYKLDPNDYVDVIAQIEVRERALLFPRITLPIVQQEKVLVRDYVSSVMEIRAARNNAEFVPVRSIGPRCDFCPFVKLCEGVIVGGDVEQLKQRLFKQDEKRGTNSDTGNANSSGEDTSASGDDFEALFNSGS